MRRSTGLAAIAGALALAWVANDVVARAVERRSEVGGHFVTVDGVRLRYLEQGAGAPVVLLHGNGGLAEDFVVSGLMEQLARTHRVIAFDRPGFGFSERPRRTAWTARAQADLVFTAFERLGIVRPVVVGHSWGALVALAVALDHPSDTAGLALLSGPMLPVARHDLAMATLPALPIIGDLLAHTIWPLLASHVWPKLLHRLFEPAAVTARFIREYPAGLSLRPKQLRAGAVDLAMMLASAESLSARAGGLSMPLLILSGAEDAVVDPQHHAVALHRMIGGDLRLIEGAGHMVHHTAPEQVADAIEAVCRRVRTGDRTRVA